MKRTRLAVAAMGAIALAGCSGGDVRNDVASNKAGETAAQPALADEPAIPTNQAEARMNERTSAPGATAPERAAPIAATEAAPPTVPKVVRREPQPPRMSAPAPKEEPVDPHAGHDMANMSH